MPTITATDSSRTWDIPLHSWRHKLAAIALILTTAAVLIYRNGSLFMAAWITRNGGTDPAVYERAIRYAPENAEYHFRLGRMYTYSAQYLNTERARQAYETAVRLNPNRVAYWLELSTYYEKE